MTMTSTHRTESRNPHASQPGAGVIAASATAALLTGLLLWAQDVPLDPIAVTDSAPPTRGVSAPPLDAGVDWQRIERAPAADGMSVAAYER
jgi:hypothetical protein